MNLKYFLNPGELINSGIRDNVPVLGIAVSGISFMLLFLLTGLDVKGGIVFPAFKGLLFGTFGIAILGLIIWIIVKGLNSSNKPGYVIGSLALCYTTSMIFTVIGFLLKAVMGWNTSISLGMSGVLFAFSPMISVITSFTGGKRFWDIAIISFAGIYVIFFWAFLNSIL